MSINIPVITIFGSQAPELASPITKSGLVIKPDNHCAHKRKHWRLCGKCMASITSLKVYEAINSYIID